MAQLANSLRETGLTEDEIISETSDLVSRYQTLMTNVNEMAGNTQGLSVDEHFKELAQDMSSWIKKLEKAINNLSSQESELPPEERILLEHSHFWYLTLGGRLTLHNSGTLRSSWKEAEMY